jgi:predicted esterase
MWDQSRIAAAGAPAQLGCFHHSHRFDFARLENERGQLDLAPDEIDRVNLVLRNTQALPVDEVTPSSARSQRTSPDVGIATPETEIGAAATAAAAVAVALFSGGFGGGAAGTGSSCLRHAVSRTASAKMVRHFFIRDFHVRRFRSGDRRMVPQQPRRVVRSKAGRARLCLLVPLLLIAIAACGPPGQFVERQVGATGAPYRFRVWLPPHYTPMRSWPVILFLHGSGERGEDNLRQLTVGLPKVLEAWPWRYPAVVVLPQCPLGEEWVGPIERQALAALDAAILEFHGDRRRLCVTGISMGGSGAWYLARHPHRFAAVLPVSGEIVAEASDPFPNPSPEVEKILQSRDPFATLAKRIGATPVWVFHGSDDTVIAVEQSRRMVAALHSAGGSVRYDELRGAGHVIWDDVYSSRRVAKWLLAQKLPR